jgi:lipopolysaccharide transport system ATP-binding protein
VSAPLVRLERVGKAFPKVVRRQDRARALLRLLAGRSPADPTVVLRDVSLEVRRGESLAVIGENGAGKSTLLKVLTGVLAPTSGRVEVNGTTAALLELGAGFHPEFTGRENIAMAGALMGFRPGELAAKHDEIAAFADIGRYLDEPVKHYSSGMVVRLGFALVAARRPDLLITDEVLAVGDEAFQRKCVRWIEDYLAGGGTLMLVSHSMYHVQKLCRHAAWLHKGELKAYGDAHDVTRQYLAFEEARIAADEPKAASTAVGLEFHVSGLALDGVDDLAGVVIGESARDGAAPVRELRVNARVHSRDGRTPVLALGVVRADGTAVYGITSEMDGAAPRRLSEHEWEFEVEFHTLDLLPGSYWVRAHAMDSEALRLFDTVERAFTVRGHTRELGLVRLAHEWTRFA